MSKLLSRAAALALCVGLGGFPAAALPERDAPTVTESFKLPITPPRDQGDSDLCWAFATLSMLETNYIAKHPGAAVAFSRGALQRESIADRFRRLVAGQGRYLEDGGIAVDALALIRADGLFAAEDFHDFVDSTPVFDQLAARLGAVPSAAQPAAMSAGLSRALGDLPARTRLAGRLVTPLEAAKAVLGDENWNEYDVLRAGGAPHVGPSDDPDARPGARVHYVTLATAVDLIHRSLSRGEAVVWGSTDNHALLIFGADYAADGKPIAYWVKDSFAPYVYKASADTIHAELTDVTVSEPEAAAAQN